MITSDFHALRVVHLPGGLRAVDVGDPQVMIQVGPDVPIFHIPRPAYAHLYAVLDQLGLSTLGVDFLASTHEFRGLYPPDWRVFGMPGGFLVEEAARAWRDVSNVAEQRTPEVLDFSGRFGTYLRLLSLRVRELSEAYNRVLRSTSFDVQGKRKDHEGGLFSSLWIVYIEAAIHAFLADAAALRDLIAEAMWRLVLHEQGLSITTLSGLLKKTKDSAHPLVL